MESFRQASAELRRQLLTEGNRVFRTVVELLDTNQLVLGNQVAYDWPHMFWYADLSDNAQLVNSDRLATESTFAFPFRVTTIRIGKEEYPRGIFEFGDIWIRPGFSVEQVVSSVARIQECCAVLLARYFALCLGKLLEHDQRVLGVISRAEQVTEAMRRLQGQVYLVSPSRLEKFSRFVDGE